MTFGEKLKKLRKGKGLTQDNLAKIINMHSRHIAKYESNQVKPTSDAIVKIAKALDVSIDYLLIEENEIMPFPKFNNKKLSILFEEVDKMDSKNQEVIIKVIDALIAKNKNK